jgi:DNA replicative helicase MCM subunit Mcm2 (Cdc46/Mcm family)
MADHVNLVGSRVSVMHLAYDCLGCTNTVAVTITDEGKDSDGHRRLVQQPRDCPNCEETIWITVVAESSQGELVAR